MDKKEMIILAVVAVIAVIVASIIFAPSNEAKPTEINLLNQGDLGENSTIYVKLKDIDGNSISAKTVHIQIKNSDGEVVYDKDAETHATGVAISPLDKIDAGNYTLEITFDGDENYTPSSFSKKITILGEEVEDIIEDTVPVETDSQTQSQAPAQTYSQNSYSQSSSVSSSDSSSSSDDLVSYDENGNEEMVEYDEDGNEV